ncbi:MAG: zf-HC2 domain-containing protein [Pirellulales bacterium]|nr:zf-HC2 domain-containing protein [Pirellulales bacterium]
MYLSGTEYLTHLTMTELSRDELIGAYLDGELSAEEKARAEQLLAESAESRQVLEELRALRSRLQGLPRMTLPADFSQLVLQRAEREMVLGMPAAAATRATVTRSEPTGPEAISMGHRWLRPLVYAGFAVAAALMIAVLMPSQQDQSASVAVRNSEESLATAPATAPTEQLAERRPEITAVPKSAPAPTMTVEGRSVPAFRSAAPEANKAASPPPAAPEAADEYGAAEDVLIVDLQITQSALARSEFQQLLGAAEIEVAGAAPGARGAGASEAAVREETTADAAPPSAGEAKSSGREMYYVEATSAQLEAVLASIDAKNADFPALVVEPAKGEGVQETWRMEFRRIPATEQTSVAADELEGELRHEVAQVLAGTTAQSETRQVQASASSTARRIDTVREAAAGAAATEAESAPTRDAASPARIRAVFVLRVVADEEPASTQSTEGVD